MGNYYSIKTVNYEDIQFAITNQEQYLIINTMLPNEQHCLILNTIFNFFRHFNII